MKALRIYFDPAAGVLYKRREDGLIVRLTEWYAICGHTENRRIAELPTTVLRQTGYPTDADVWLP